MAWIVEFSPKPTMWYSKVRIYSRYQKHASNRIFRAEMWSLLPLSLTLLLRKSRLWRNMFLTKPTDLEFSTNWEGRMRLPIPNAIPKLVSKHYLLQNKVLLNSIFWTCKLTREMQPCDAHGPTGLAHWPLFFSAVLRSQDGLLKGFQLES